MRKPQQARRAVALATVLALGLAACGGQNAEPSEAPVETSDAAAPPVTAPEPTPILNPTPTPSVQVPKMQNLSTSGWRESRANDGRGSFLTPPEFSWAWEWSWAAGVPEGEYIDVFTITSGGKEVLRFQDSLTPQPMCSGDGEGVVLDATPLPASDKFTVTTVAIPADRGVQLAAGVLPAERVEEVRCGVSFYINDPLPYSFATHPVLPDPGIPLHWRFATMEEAAAYLGTTEFQQIRASLLSFQPPAK